MCSCSFSETSNRYFDGHRDDTGRRFELGENRGACLNHSKNMANCRLLRDYRATGRTRLFLMTMKDVPAGVELTWDYGDRRRDNEDWLGH